MYKQVGGNYMNSFLDLTYYKRRNFIFPNYLKPKVDSNFVGILTHYVELSKSNYGTKLFELFHEKNDVISLRELIIEHGVFFEKFYAKTLRTRVNVFFNSNHNPLPIIKLCNSYYNKEYKETTAIKVIKEDFIKVSLNNLKNESSYKILLDSVNVFSKTRCCEICGNNYKVINFPDWVYFGSNGNTSICYECPVNNKIEKSDLIPLIKKLVERCNFIPNADFNPLNDNFSIRLRNEDWVDVCKIIFDMGIDGNDKYGSSKKIKQKFGSWFKALIEAGVLPNGTMETSRGIKCLAKSGNECLSLDEMFIDNWFYENNIKTVKEPYYPKHPMYNKHGRRRADWKIGEYYIEYFGLKGEESYDKKTKEKIELAKSLNLKLVSIYPSDLSNLSDKLMQLKF